MTKVSRPLGLIGYDNDLNVQRRISGKEEVFKPVRARTVVYASLITVVCAVMLYALMSRTLLDVNVLHDRNPIAVRLSDGSARNGYTLRFLNKRGFDRVIAIDVDGPADAKLHVVGADSVTPDRPMIVLGRDTTTELRVLVTAPFDEKAEKSVPVTFRITDIGLGEVASATDHFVLP
jgi:polyferredoxin